MDEEKKNVLAGDSTTESVVNEQPVENEASGETVSIQESEVVEESQNTVTVEETKTEEGTTNQEETKVEEPPIETFDVNKIDKPKKKLPVGLIVILVLVCIAAGAGVYAYRYFSANPTSIVKKVINRAYEDFSKSLDEVDKGTSDIDIFNETVRVSGDFQFNDSSVKGLDKEKIEYDVALDYSNKQAEGLIGLLKSGSRVADAKVYFENDKMYLGSSTMFDNIYDMGEYKFDDMFDFSDFQDIDMSDAPTTDDIDYLVKEFKDVLLDSLDEKEMTIKKEDLKIEGKTVKTNKISYKISNSSMENLKASISDNVLKNEALISKLASVTGESEEEIKKAFEEFKTSPVSDERIAGEFVLYTTGLDYTLVKVELSDTIEKIYMTSYDDVTSLVYDSQNGKYEIISTKEKNTYDVDIKIGGIRLANLIIRDSKTGLDLDYKIMYSGVQIDGTIKCTYEETGEKQGEGEIFFSVNGNVMDETFGYEMSLNYNMTADEALDGLDTSKVLKDFTESDTDKLTGKLGELEDSVLFGYFSGMAESYNPVVAY